MIKIETHTQLFHVISFGDRTQHRKKKRKTQAPKHLSGPEKHAK